MTLPSSASIGARPAVRRSTVSRWAAEAGVSVVSGGSASVFIELIFTPREGTRPTGGLVGHQIKDDVDAEGVAAFFGEFMEKEIVLAFALPAIAIVAVMGRNDHNAALVIVNGADVHVLAFFAVMALPGVLRGVVLGGVGTRNMVNAGCLQLVHRSFEIKDAMEQLIGHVQA